jgi:hypothetical protein
MSTFVFDNDEKFFLQTIQSLRSDEETIDEIVKRNLHSISTYSAGMSYTTRILNAVLSLMHNKPNYHIKLVLKDSLLKLIKDAIEYDMRKNIKRKQLNSQSYQHFYNALVESRILFVSTSDLDFLQLFYQKQKEIFPIFVQRSVILAENREERSSKSCFFEPTNQKHFHFTSGETNEFSHTKKCHYLIHSVHNTDDLEDIFTTTGIRLKGNCNKDYYGAPLTWFGTFNQESSNTSRYGSLTFKIDIDKVLAKGSNYFAMGTRKYTREHSHSILITNCSNVRMQTKSNSSPLEFDFPRMANIEQNQLCKKENNEWFLNDRLQLNDTCGDWDHPEFCLETNDIDGYVYFNFYDIKIEFFKHSKEESLCVNFRKKTEACQDKLASQESFIRLMKAGKVPSLLKLRKRLSDDAFRELFQIKFPIGALSEKLLEFVKFELCQVERIDQSCLIKMKFNAFVRNDLDEILAKLGQQSDSFAQIRSDLVEKFTEELRNIAENLSPAKKKKRAKKTFTSLHKRIRNFVFRGKKLDK